MLRSALRDAVAHKDYAYAYAVAHKDHAYADAVAHKDHAYADADLLPLRCWWAPAQAYASLLRRHMHLVGCHMHLYLDVGGFLRRNDVG